MKALLNLNARKRPAEREREAFRAELRWLSHRGTQMVEKATLLEWIVRSAWSPHRN